MEILQFKLFQYFKDPEHNWHRMFQAKVLESSKAMSAHIFQLVICMPGHTAFEYNCEVLRGYVRSLSYVLPWHLLHVAGFVTVVNYVQSSLQ